MELANPETRGGTFTFFYFQKGKKRKVKNFTFPKKRKVKNFTFPKKRKVK
jgi:hypothetical protein